MGEQAGAILLPGDRIYERTHTLDERWLRARVAGWMQIHAQRDWWVMAVTTDGRFVYAGEFKPTQEQYDLARRVVRAVNKNANHGGAWIVGYKDGELYMLWKDSDGDLQMEWMGENITQAQLLEWSDDNFALQCEMMWAQWDEWHRAMEYGKGQRKRLAQGERLTPEHDKEAIET